MEYLTDEKFSHIYIHVPFCKKKCRYCAFYSVDSFDSSLIELYASSLTYEIMRYSEKLDRPVSLYVGGGTPSVLDRMFFEKIFEVLTPHKFEEVTVEANPESLSAEMVNFLKESGVNRLSIGVQALEDTRLSWLGRVHTVDQALSAIGWALEAGFKVLNVDFMVGVPGEDVRCILRELSSLINMGVQHISVYLLTPEHGTPLFRDIRKGNLTLPDEGTAVNHLIMVWEYLKDQGYNHYEVSNFSYPGMECIHNFAYWKRRFYAGCGPGASGFLPCGRWGMRYTNLRSIDEYSRKVKMGVMPFSYTEVLTREKALLELIFLSLRTQRGLRKEDVDQFDIVWREVQNICYEFEEEGLLYVEYDAVKPSEKGMLVADGLARRIWEALIER